MDPNKKIRIRNTEGAKIYFQSSEEDLKSSWHFKGEIKQTWKK
jgi:hypothetical protein